MNWPELTPMTPPLECFALDYRKHDPVCVACQHNAECQRYMLSRLNTIPMHNVKFQIVPEVYALRFNIDADDPDATHLQRVYIQCYMTVFNREPAQSAIGMHAAKITENIRKSECSVKLFMLSNMIGHQRMEKDKEAQAVSRATPFTVWKLTETRSVERAKMYAELCRSQFGSFTTSTLSTLTERSDRDNDLENRMLNSELCAGRWIVEHKIYHQGNPYETMYEQIEDDLDPAWLAVEDSYKLLVLDKNVGLKKGSDRQRAHRYSVVQAIGFMKRHKNSAGVAFKARQDIMPQALSGVLETFGFNDYDFNIVDKPVTNPLELWVTLGRTIQHWNLLKYLNGGDSLFDK